MGSSRRRETGTQLVKVFWADLAADDSENEEDEVPAQPRGQLVSVRWADLAAGDTDDDTDDEGADLACTEYDKEMIMEAFCAKLCRRDWALCAAACSRAEAKPAVEGLPSGPLAPTDLGAVAAGASLATAASTAPAVPSAAAALGAALPAAATTALAVPTAVAALGAALPAAGLQPSGPLAAAALGAVGAGPSQAKAAVMPCAELAFDAAMNAALSLDHDHQLHGKGKRGRPRAAKAAMAAVAWDIQSVNSKDSSSEISTPSASRRAVSFGAVTVVEFTVVDYSADDCNDDDTCSADLGRWSKAVDMRRLKRSAACCKGAKVSLTLDGSGLPTASVVSEAA